MLDEQQVSSIEQCFHLFTQLPDELQLRVLELSLESTGPIWNPNPRTRPDKAGCRNSLSGYRHYAIEKWPDWHDPEGIHLSHVSNILRTSKMFREEGIKLLLNNQGVLFTQEPCQDLQGNISNQLIWSSELKNPGAILTVPPGFVTARLGSDKHYSGYGSTIWHRNLIGNRKSRRSLESSIFLVAPRKENQDQSKNIKQEILHGRIRPWEDSSWGKKICLSRRLVWKHLLKHRQEAVITSFEEAHLPRIMSEWFDDSIKALLDKPQRNLSPIADLAYMKLKYVETRWVFPPDRHHDLKFSLAVWQATAFPRLEELTIDFVNASHLPSPNFHNYCGKPLSTKALNRIQLLVIRGLSNAQLKTPIGEALWSYVAPGGKMGITEKSHFRLIDTSGHLSVDPTTGSSSWVQGLGSPQAKYELQSVSPEPIVWKIKKFPTPGTRSGVWEQRFQIVMKELVSFFEGHGSVKRVRFLEDQDSAQRTENFPFFPALGDVFIF